MGWIEGKFTLECEKLFFRGLPNSLQFICLKKVLGAFMGFTFEDFSIPEQSFEDYKSKYLDLNERIKDKVSGFE